MPATFLGQCFTVPPTFASSGFGLADYEAQEVAYSPSRASAELTALSRNSVPVHPQQYWRPPASPQQ